MTVWYLQPAAASCLGLGVLFVKQRYSSGLVCRCARFCYLSCILGNI
jgi:hypothetical protein